MKLPEKQLTNEPFGHCLNTTQCVSPCGRYIVYDTRSNDAALAANGQIRVVDLETGEDQLVYETRNQTAYGPGVGAATWSPDGKMLLFLGGIQNADQGKPYSFTRRTGIGIEWCKPQIPIWMDARDMNTATTPGALRGGTHAHTWSGRDNWISFTYNDHLIAEAAKTDASLADLRTVGIMFPGTVKVPGADGVEMKDGTMYSVLIVPVHKDPRPGSDEVNKAFDECWIGRDGYINEAGQCQRKSIAYQANVVCDNGQLMTGLFVADIPDNLPEWVKLHPATAAAAKMPDVPGVINRRRIDIPGKGISSSPRHWLRSTPDGRLIGYFAEDEQGIVQLWAISPNGGEPRQLSHLPASAEGPFNFSYDGKYAACIADERVWLIRVDDGATEALTSKESTKGPLNGAVIWSPIDYTVYYNRYVARAEGVFLQIFSVSLP